MGYGQGKYLNKNNLPTAGEYRMNLGGPSSETLQKLETAYTCESRILKLLSHYKLCENSCHPKVKPLVLTDNLKVDPVAFALKLH